MKHTYCQNDEERRWFLTNEIELFRYRFNLMTKTEQLSYLKNSPNIKQFYDVVNDEQKQELKQELINSSSSFHYTHIQQTFDEVTYFRVRFQHVPDLVRLRRCYLRAGYAYISEHDIISFVLQQYRTSLSYQMTCASKKFHLMKKLDTRIASVLKVLGMKRTVGVTTTNFNENEQTETITYDMLDTLAKKSYPLCMRHLHEQMTKQHHLKHLGRLQYRLFLKGIGLSLDECLKFFRNEFVSNGSMNPTQFEREHVYNIRHAYGQEGKHTSYTPYSCVKIIQDPPPGVNEYHGCPYRHWDPNTLKQRLSTNYGIHDEQVLNEIVDRSQNHHYQIACQIYFEYQHNVKNHGIGINHPNQYFNESRKILTGGATASTKPTES
ncbi:unnamed protein product [Didymodactylos carnosus]|uniref:DNA primase large subunit n=1 Tax=Didymodactylos carnosus TaxID=1234261 RepID=A0A813T392_9BILA|nr:unnamed protein product [Didymodactylos carnosus]CAF0903537.1 unnamed protein product [Didymodactylos carnosus]CAF3590276.1 unnamed protein product [Didymodactylos carnosus]CAF3683756.1 unnamed protein product [Didymodactylos carnosus]